MKLAPQPVLTYASPINAKTPDAPTAMELTFERPSVASETTLCVIAIAMCLLALVGIGLLLAQELRDDFRRLDERSIFIAGGIGAAIILGILLFTVRSMIRLRRFGCAPVHIVLDAERIVISDPVRLGAEPRILPLSELRRCRCERLSLESGRYAIMFTLRSWRRRRVRVDVAAHERGIVERAAADLQRAIVRTNM